MSETGDTVDFSHLTYNGPRCTFIVLSRPRIRHASIEQPYIIISISDPGEDDAEIAASSCCRAILRLQFDDIDPNRQAVRGRAAMTNQQAQAILDFVIEHMGAGEVRTVVCQCGMGISRSA